MHGHANPFPRNRCNFARKCNKIPAAMTGFMAYLDEVSLRPWPVYGKRVKASTSNPFGIRFGAHVTVSEADLGARHP